MTAKSPFAIKSESYDRHLIPQGYTWILTLTDWSHVPADVTPINTSTLSFADSLRLPESNAYYGKKEFRFQNPPSREDFVTVVLSNNNKAHYRNVAEKLLPYSQWPIVDGHMKAASTDLFDETGRKVGSLDVRRSETFNNAPHGVPNFFPHQHRRRGSKFNDWMDSHRHLINERIVNENAGGSVEEQAVVIEALWKECNAKPKGKKKKQPAAA